MMLWLVAFAWTIALELPIYTMLLRMRRWWSPVVLTLGVNAATHPALWFAFPQFEPYWQYVLIAEACVVGVEAAIIAMVTGRAGLALVASITANTVSTVVGLLLMPLVL